MSSFTVDEEDGDGRARLGSINSAQESIDTPAFFPVLEFIGGTTPQSGGIWSRVRNHLFASEEFNGALYQALSFLNFGLTPSNLEDWREKTLREHFTNHSAPKAWHPEPESFTEPLFVDSGGYRLMQSDTFRVDSDEELDNEWAIGTTPESILELQRDYGADIIATLDFPIPQGLEEDEKRERMNRSIDSALEALELLESDSRFENWDPTVYVAIHGHDFEEINWYVGEVLQQASDTSLIDGFAIGSLVPLRSNIETLVDIVQGAVDAIPDQRRDEYGIHVFGISGKLFGLMSLLGVDSFDSTTYVQAARNRSFIHPDTWQKTGYEDLESDNWDCRCEACEKLDLPLMKRVMRSDQSYSDIEGTDYIKSDFYALMAHHNFLLYEKEISLVRRAIQQERLLEHIVDLATNNADVRKGLRYAQLRDAELREPVKSLSEGLDIDLLPPHEEETKSDSSSDASPISLKYSASDYDVSSTDFSPSGAPVLLILPCSQTKPYSDSKTHRTVEKALDGFSDSTYEKLTVSGLYGPVPEEHEKLDQIMRYDYVLNDIDQQQQEAVLNRLQRYLDAHGEEYDEVVAYAVSKRYRAVIEEALESMGFGTLLPRDPRRRQLWEQNREENLDELRAEIDKVLQSDSAITSS